MSETRALLIEIGTEELPPTALPGLSKAFADGVEQRLIEAGLAPAGVTRYATPRRLALLVDHVATKQLDRNVLRRGPSMVSAFDTGGNPTKAALGFARSCGVDIGQLGEVETEKGRCLSFEQRESGQETATLIPKIVSSTLAKLPIPKRMRWGDGDREFVRPVHWIVLLLGDQLIESEILGIKSDRHTRGHRFHHPAPILLSTASDYASALKDPGMVVAEFDARRERIKKQITLAAAEHGNAVINNELLNEVTALVEWPVALTASFDEEFLELPEEVLIASMQDHQRYFPIRSPQATLLSRFVTVVNIESRSPNAVRLGNERVIRPRLSDARFFWQTDLAQPLASRFKDLEGIVYQKQLGSVADRSRRLMAVSKGIADELDADGALAERAALLSQCDLVTEMVGEFPKLQGTMGRYYAAHAGEAIEVADALDEAYMPRHAGDALPKTTTGQILAIATRIDTLIGIFGTGLRPSGDKDPFGLRRAALGCLRIMLERRIDVHLVKLLETAKHQYGDTIEEENVVGDVFDFMLERLRHYYLDAGIPTDVFEAVLARRPDHVLDFAERLRAVHAFRALPAADSLAAANKRISNILRKAGEEPEREIASELLNESAEQALAQALGQATEDVDPLLNARDYTNTLVRLAELRDPVDTFFKEVLVMDEDNALRRNRLALLNNLNNLFLRVADIGRLRS